MLDIREIEYWISRYEKEADKLDDCVTLSALYSIRDKMLGESMQLPQIAAYSEDSVPIREALDQYGDSEFLQAVSGKDSSSVWAVIDELMNTLRAVNPKAYDAVMRKIERL